MTHASVPRDVQLQMGITPDLIRISVGLEDVATLSLTSMPLSPAENDVTINSAVCEHLG